MLFARFWRPDDATRGEADLEARGVDRAGTQIAFARGAGDWHGRIPKLERQLAARRLGRAIAGLAVGVAIDVATIERRPDRLLGATGPTFEEDGFFPRRHLERRIAIVVGWATDPDIRAAPLAAHIRQRSAERRVGHECVSTCCTRRSPARSKK